METLKQQGDRLRRDAMTKRLTDILKDGAKTVHEIHQSAYTDKLTVRRYLYGMYDYGLLTAERAPGRTGRSAAWFSLAKNYSEERRQLYLDRATEPRARKLGARQFDEAVSSPRARKAAVSAVERDPLMLAIAHKRSIEAAA